MSQQLRFLEIKIQSATKSGKTIAIPIEDREIVCKKLKDNCQGKDLESDKDRKKIFKEHNVKFIINAYNNDIEPFLRGKSIYLIPDTSIYMVNTEMWQAIKKNVLKQASEECKMLSMKEINAKYIITMLKIEKIFDQNRLVVEAS